MSSSTSSLVMALGEASSGRGPQGAMLLEQSRRPLDHLLVDSALSKVQGVGDSFGTRAAVRDHDRLPDAEQDRPTRLVRVDLVAQHAEPPADQEAADGGHAARADRFADW